MTRTTRRRLLASGLAGVTVIAIGGVVWRAWENGVFSVGAGPAYSPWHDWRAETDGPMALVRAGILAANAHNTQPWRFRAAGDRVALHADHDRHLGSFDPFRREMQLSLGCVVENMVQAAAAQGRGAEVAAAAGALDLGLPADADQPVAIVTLTSDPPSAAVPALSAAIPDRRTHRGAYVRDRVPSAALQDQMRGLAADESSLRLFLFDHEPDRRRLGELIVAATEAIVADHEMAADSARWFRLDWKAVQRHRDGVTLDTVGLPPLVNAAAKILPAPSPDEADRQWLRGTREVHVATAPLYGIIAVRDLYDRPTALAAGRLWQRLHLWATVQGLAAQPLNQPVEIVDREAELGAAPRMAAALAGVTGDAGWRPTFVFRLGHADRPARMSPRRPAAEVLAV